MTTAIGPKQVELDWLADYCQRMQPKVVVEWGCGHSTKVMLEALSEKSHLSVIEANLHYWHLCHIQLTPSQRECVLFCNAEVIVRQVGSHLVASSQNLPDVVPDFCYVDGPYHADVQGSVRGLTFANRGVVSDDLCLYEWSLNPGCVVRLDGRPLQAAFWRKHLQRDWQWEQDGKATILTLRG